MKRTLIAALLLCAAATAPAAALELTFTAIKVNGTTIPASRVQIDLGGRQQASQMLHGSAPTGSSDARKVDQVVERIIVRELLMQEARRRGLGVTEAEVAAAWEAERGRWGGEDKFRKSLDVRGVSADYLHERVAEDLLQRKLVRELYAGIAITEQDERAYHAKNPDFFRAAGDPPLRLLYFDNAKHGGPKGALKRYWDFRKRLDKGELFAALIPAFSDHPTAGAGGLLGDPPDPSLPFLDQARRLVPGQFSDPRAGDRGYYCYFRDRHPPVLGFEQVREKVGAKLLEEQRRERIDGLVAKLKGSAKIEFVAK